MVGRNFNKPIFKSLNALGVACGRDVTASNLSFVATVAFVKVNLLHNSNIFSICFFSLLENDKGEAHTTIILSLILLEKKDEVCARLCSAKHKLKGNTGDSSVDRLSELINLQ